jgi:hypothetical protein
MENIIWAFYRKKQLRRIFGNLLYKAYFVQNQKNNIKRTVKKETVV